jgi:hypothetical protein
MSKNTAAAALGRMALGVPKNYSEAELAKRAERLAKAREKRWPKKAKAKK